MTSQRPTFLFSMVPRNHGSFRDFFESVQLRSLLEAPAQIRPAGWDLVTHDRARIIKGDYLELRSAERKRIQVYEDGSIFVRVSGDQDFLSWGINEDNFKQMPRLNTLALVEFSLNFCNLCSELIKCMQPESSEVELAVEIKNAFLESSKLFLIPHPVSSNWWTFSDDRHYAPEPSTKRKLSIATQQLISRPDVVAFLLLRQIFLWFGVASDMIPYSSSEGDLKFIDPHKIQISRSS
jgi:hypothetical protein